MLRTSLFKKAICLGALVGASLSHAGYEYRVPIQGIALQAEAPIPVGPSLVGDGVSKEGACATGAATGCSVLAKETANDSSTYLSADSRTLYLNYPYRRGGNGTKFVTDGKWYAELTFAGNAITTQWVGILDSGFGGSYASTPVSTGSNNVAWLGNSLYAGDAFAGVVPAPARGDILGLALDLKTRTLSLYRNCVYVSSVPVPAGVSYAPFAVMGNTEGTSSVTLNAGQASFGCAVPVGFNKGWW